MAVYLRRVLKNYNSISYHSVLYQHSVIGQRNTPSSSPAAIEVDKSILVPRVPVNNPYCFKGPNSHPSEAENVGNEHFRNELCYLGNDLLYDKVYLSTVLEKQILYCAKECEAFKEKEEPKDGSPMDRPGDAQLQRIRSKLTEDLPRIFEKPLDAEIYHENLIFQNNIMGTTTVGLRNYLKQIAFLKVYASVKYSSVRFEILKITTHEEDGTVRVRWRIRGVPGFKVIVLFWKQKLWRQKENIESQDGWFDGFSIFHVRGDGLVHKHVATKLMPGNESSALKVKHPFATNMAFIIGLISQDQVVALPKEEYEKLVKDPSIIITSSSIIQNVLNIQKITPPCSQMSLLLVTDSNHRLFKYFK